MTLPLLALLNDPSHGLTAIADASDGIRVLAPALSVKLGYPRTERLLALVPDEEKGVMEVVTPGGKQKTNYVTLPGFFRSLGSRPTVRITDPEVRKVAEDFQNWVYKDVVPSVYFTGMYETEEHAERMHAEAQFLATNCGTFARAAEAQNWNNAIIAAARTEIALEAAVATMTNRALELDPDYPDAVVNAIREIRNPR